MSTKFYIDFGTDNEKLQEFLDRIYQIFSKVREKYEKEYVKSLYACEEVPYEKQIWYY
jgi:hypothetical protein